VVLEDTLAQVQGEISTGLISVYTALGGGWELRYTGCTPGVAPVGDESLPVPRKLDDGGEGPASRATFRSPVAK
jgi:hypothetical protein